MPALIEPLREAPAQALGALLAESEQSGLGFVRRLVDEWTSGANRFGRPGEVLLVARTSGRAVGVCGLNIDPYAAEPNVGRVRHLYVLAGYRRLGIGGGLVTAVIEAARGPFDRLHLRTANPAAARLYERLGFRPCAGARNCTHVMELCGRA
jgi:ribosomal protein S18 acetylase RimI-like enzyme